jgi:hypothetical protein
MEEAMPLATIENSIQIILKDYMEKVNSGDNLSDIPVEQSNYGRPAFDIVSLPRFAPSIMSDNVSIRSQNFNNQVEGFKK